MAGPLYASVGSRSQSAGAATISPAKPTLAGTGGVLLAVVTSKNNATHSTATGGWNLIGQVNSGASFTASLWIAAETAAAPTFTWTGSVACSAQIAYYTDPDGTVTTTVAASANNNGTTATHSTTGFNTTANEALVVYVDVAAANTAIAQPSGWTEDVDNGSATDAGRTAFGSKSVATSGTGSGNISVTGANAAWVQWQVELLQAAPSAGLQSSKVGVGAWLNPGNGHSASKIEAGAWLEFVGGTGRRRQIVN